jgi:leucine-rich repeat-containing G protein-coupled receptor 6
LGNNQFPHLPEQGLSNLYHLKTFNNPNLREFPGPQHFPRILTLVLSYAYHCCAFLPPEDDDQESLDPQSNKVETVIFPPGGGSSDNDFWKFWNSSESNIWPKRKKFQAFLASI